MNRTGTLMIVGLLALFGAGATAKLYALNNGLARTPPMGFNTWNYFGCNNITDSLMRGVADMFISKGLKDAGYQYVNIDDCWALGSRNASGGLVAKPQAFPKGMRSLADYIHSKGLKLGIYTDVGTSTCATCYGGTNPQGLPGLQDHEQQDCDTFVAWGIDYVKVDYCCAGSASGGNAKLAYTKVRDCLTNAVTRMKSKVPDAHPIVYSICNWGEQKPWEWGDAVGNLWRTTGDISSSWSKVLSNLDASQLNRNYSRIGSWNDPDMLEVGIGDFKSNYARARSHFSLWCMAAAPLITGTDLKTMDATIQSILTNTDAIAINQDTLSGDTTLGIIEGKKIVSGNSEVWVKLLTGKIGSEYAVLFFNRGNSGAVSMSITPDQIKQVGGDIANGKKYKVRDVWGKKDLDDWTITADGKFTSPAQIGVNDAFLMRLSIPPVKVASQIASVKVTSTDVLSEGQRILIKSKKTGLLSVRIVNLKGEVVYSQKMDGSLDCSIPTNGFSRGLYIVNIQNTSEHLDQKIYLN
jgi:alpha-galactosidase